MGLIALLPHSEDGYVRQQRIEREVESMASTRTAVSAGSASVPTRTVGDMGRRARVAGAPLSPAVRDLLASAARCLMAAADADSAGERYAASHLAALRSAAAVLASRGRPNGRSRPRSAWDLLATVAPEFAEWSAFFAAGATKRAAAEAGLNVVTEREADDLMRDAEKFLGLVAARFGLTQQLLMPASQLRTVG